jgi:short-subunit dehydrogenase
MTKDNDHMFWVASPEKAARQIYKAISAKKHVAYITKRWWLMAKVVKHLPDFVWLRI